MRIPERTLYRVALATLTVALVMVSVSYTNILRRERALSAEVNSLLGRISRYSDNVLDHQMHIRKLVAEGGRLRAEITKLRGQNKDRFEGLEMIRKTGKSQE